jgi:hypothetical protein
MPSVAEPVGRDVDGVPEVEVVELVPVPAVPPARVSPQASTPEMTMTSRRKPSGSPQRCNAGPEIRMYRRRSLSRVV